MTLRTRIAAVASLSVALAVLAAAVGLYVAVRSDLRGEIDKALNERAQAFLAPAAPLGPADGGELNAPTRPLAGAPGAGSQAASEPHGGVPAAGGSGGGYDSGPGRFPGSIEPAPFGAASGYVQFIMPGGTVDVPAGQGASPTRIAVTAADRAIAASGSGRSVTDRSVLASGGR